MKVVDMPIISFSEIPESLHEVARRMEIGEISNVAGAILILSGPDSTHPAVYNFGNFGLQQTIGCIDIAKHRIMSYGEPVRNPLRKPK